MIISKEVCVLSDKQFEVLKSWYYKNHRENEYSGAIGGELTFTIIPTSIGNFITVKDNKGNKLNLTDM